jgi:hypothetical protein
VTPSEKTLYHQIHPLKLFTDVSTAFAATYLLWQHMLLIAIVVAFVPSIIVSMILIMTADLERYKDSAVGRYVRKYMDSKVIDAVRLFGFLLMAVGGWIQLMWLIGLGFLIIVLSWTFGLFDRKAKK